MKVTMTALVWVGCLALTISAEIESEDNFRPKEITAMETNLRQKRFSAFRALDLLAKYQLENNYFGSLYAPPIPLQDFYLDPQQVYYEQPTQGFYVETQQENFDDDEADIIESPYYRI